MCVVWLYFFAHGLLFNRTGQDHVGNVDVDHLTLAWRSIEWMRVGSKDAPRSMFVCDLYFGLRVICCKLNIA